MDVIASPAYNYDGFSCAVRFLILGQNTIDNLPNRSDNWLSMFKTE